MGNKGFKLKYNLKAARAQGVDTIISFGGAYSNHIAALAEAGHRAGLKTIGVVRGQELGASVADNPTLRKAGELGMQFVFVAGITTGRSMIRNF